MWTRFADLLVAYLGLLAGLVVLSSVLWTGYLLAVAATAPTGTKAPGGSVALRVCTAATVSYWFMMALFEVLAAASWFRLPVVLVLCVGAAVAVQVAGGRPQQAAERLRRDCRSGWHVLGALSGSLAGLLALGVAAVIVLRLTRGLVAPPLAWDALTYHLVKAGRWVQQGGWVTEAAPDAWQYYGFFPPFGDVIWAWAMLPAHGDALLAGAGVLVWGTCVIGTFAAARALGAAQRRALLAALVVGCTPAVMSLLTTAYVENVNLGLFLLAFVFLHRWVRERRARWVMLAMTAWAIGVGVKLNTVIFPALGGPVILLLALQRTRARWRLATAGAAVAGLVIVMPPYLTVWRATGSPTYPVPVALGGRTIFAGSPELAGVLSGAFLPGALTFSPTTLLVALFLPPIKAVIQGLQFDGLGPAAPVLVLLALVAVPRLLRDKGARLPTLYLLACALLVVLSIFPADVLALRTYWVGVLGRFLTVSLAVAAILTATLPAAISEPALDFALGINLLLSIPRGWGPTDVRVLPWLLLAGAVVAAVTLAVARLGRRRTALALGVIGCSAVYCVVTSVRQSNRYRYYAEAAARQTYDLHPLTAQWAASWPLWRFFDGATPTTLAVTAGWNGVGDNWYRYPLLGSRLQNHVVYVPITADGHIVDYREAAATAAQADFGAWVRHLHDRRVDAVVVLPPEPIEARWLRAHPERFSLAAAGVLGWAQAYRLEPEAPHR